ncbi:MAG: alpha/beta hydrolase [Psychroserpens sp.]|uniref:alpha/beta fold hydrolase n=1 Tax=Psychroserpens sp. TaxID=2020870 RepID=UPI003C77B222
MTTYSSKPTLVFIHYFGGDAGSWNWFAKKFGNDYQCEFLTLPGFGQSQPLERLTIRGFSEWIAAQIKALKVTDYILIGHSMGGKLALFTTLVLHDHLPKSLILIAPSPPTIEQMPDDEKKRMLNHPDADESETTVRKATGKSLRKKRFDYAVKSQMKVDHNTWSWWINKGMSNDISWTIKNLDIPVFVICGRKDDAITTDHIHNDVMPYLNNAKLITFGRAGHLIPLESPRKLAKVIRKIVSY